MALTKNVTREFGSIGPQTADQIKGVKDDVIIYEGAAVSLDSNGHLKPLAAGEDFYGFAMQMVDSNGAAAGAKTVRVKREGSVVLNVVGVAGVQHDTDAAYASDDGTFTLTSTSNSLIGRTEQWKSGTKCWVRFWGIGTKP